MNIFNRKIAACFSSSTPGMQTRKNGSNATATLGLTVDTSTESRALWNAEVSQTSPSPSPASPSSIFCQSELDSVSAFSDCTDFSPDDDRQIQQTIQIYMFGQTNSSYIGSTDPRNTKEAPPKLDVLSLHDRGVTVVGWNESLEKRCVIRVSPRGRRLKRRVTARDISGSQQAAERILLFGRFLYKIEPQIEGLVPFLSRPKLVKNRFLVEQYEEILCESHGNRRLDLHSYIVDNMDGANARKGFQYLHDVLKGVISLHRHGWAHLDLSLENVVLSDDHAYIIDFESVLPFATEQNGCLRRRDLRVPLKSPFVPPEHFEAGSEDLLALPSYDVWAFGVMFFTVLFREYVFASREVVGNHGSKQLVPDRGQIEFFMEHGFRKFMKKYHPQKYMLLFHSGQTRFNKNGKRSKVDARTSSYLSLCGDLLSNIFRRPCRVPVTSIVAHGTDGTDGTDGADADAAYASQHRVGDGVDGFGVDPMCSMVPIYYCDCARSTAQDVYDHPFWEVHGIRTASA